MAAFVVMYEGQRRSVKAPANALMQTVLVESCEHFGLNPAMCSLKAKKVTLDCSQPIRFSNLSNNAILDLIASSPSSSSGNGGSNPVSKIALSVQSGGSAQASFPASATLKDVINGFAEQGIIPSSALEGDSQLVYLRSTFSGQQLETTTLSSLGLAGQAGRMVLRMEGATTTAAAPMLVTPPVLSERAPCPPPCAVAPAPAEHISTADAAIELCDVQCTASVLETNTSHDEIPRDPPQEPAVSLPTPMEAVQAILQTNFDAASVHALVTLGKYLANILSQPDDIRFRNIKTANKVFAEKVASCRGAGALLQSIGFEYTGEAVVLPMDAPLQRAHEGWQALLWAFDELHVEVEQRPSVRVLQSPRQEAVAFDPFKALVTSTAPQIPRTESATDKELARLAARREELEGDPSVVARRTQVLLPGRLRKGARDEDKEEEEDVATGGASSLPVSLLKKICAKEEEAPLTTRALRDLQRAQRERVYDRTLVRIRMPDKAELLGYFHPRHTMVDVYQWVAGCVGTEAPALDAFLDVFELYVSPPRTVLAPFKNVNVKRRRVDGNEESATLLALSLVPAAVINLAWRDATLSLRPELLAAAASDARPVLAVPVGSRLVEAQAPNDKATGVAPTQPPEGNAAERVKVKPKWFKM